MKNIHVLATDKPSRLFIDVDDNKLKICVPLGEKHMMNQHIYITSDEEIKDGDWMIRGNEQPTLVTPNFFWDFGVRYYKIILTTDQDLIKDGVQAIDDTFLEWFVKNPSCEFVEVVEDKKLSSKNIYNAVEGDLVYSHHGYGGIINSLSNDVRVGIGNYLETALTSETGWETLDINNYRIYDKCYKIIIPQEEPKQEPCDNCNNDVCCCIIRKQETLEEAAEIDLTNLCYYDKRNPDCSVDDEDIEDHKKSLLKKDKTCSCDNCFYGRTELTKQLIWQAERMYIEEDMINFAKYILSKKVTIARSPLDVSIYLPKEFQLLSGELKHDGKKLLKEWFEQFKKK